MISFNKAPFAGREPHYVEQATKASNLCGNGDFTKKCQEQIAQLMGNDCKVFLTTSCTASLELAALLLDMQPGDEVILPSFTFVSSVNAFVLRGAVPVMIDIDPRTMNMDHTNLEAAITAKTRVIVPVHYGGVACEMDFIMALAEKHNIKVVEDAAPSLTATYKDQALGSIGHVGCFSFHETKNFTSGGQGGAIVINDRSLFSRAEILYDNGTNRRAFFRGEIKQYGWVDVGSNFIMSEIQAAYLWAQLEQATAITERRRQIWAEYESQLQPLAHARKMETVQIAQHCHHNAHMYYIKMADRAQRGQFAQHMKEADIICSPHYVPLHHRDIFRNVGGRFVGEDVHTTAESDKLIRLPLYHDLTAEEQSRVIAEVKRFFDLDKGNDLRASNGQVNGIDHSQK